MNEVSSFVFLKIQICFYCKKKKMILIRQNTKSVLWYVEKMVFGDKNSNLCLFHKIKSFELKNIRSVFKNKEKNVF